MTSQAILIRVTSHITFHQQKMKVSFAVQALSASVATAIEHCNQVLKIPDFKGSEGTVKFLRVIDRLFDVMNSTNFLGKGPKAALKPGNKDEWSPFLEEAFQYIKTLKNIRGQLVCRSKQKTVFLGFMLGIKSCKGLFEDLVEGPGAPLKFILTYKFSQDHLEHFFGATRLSLGCNNNPTAQQFIAAYKRLLMRSSIGGKN